MFLCGFLVGLLIGGVAAGLILDGKAGVINILWAPVWIPWSIFMSILNHFKK